MSKRGNDEHALFRALPAVDETKVSVGVRSDGGGVVLKFETEERFHWVLLTKEQALMLAGALQKCAAALPEQERPA